MAEEPKEIQNKPSVEDMQLSLSDLIAGMIQATVDADQAVTEDYLQTFSAYAFEPSNKRGGAEKLRMVQFEITDEDGRRQVVSIPKLSLLPLPVLHISEATFDIEAEMYIHETSSSEETQVAASGKKKTTGRTKAKTVQDIYKEATALSLAALAAQRNNKQRFLYNRKLAEGIRVVVKGADSSSSDSEQKINTRIHIELRPSILPNGMRGMLQEADRSIEIIEKSQSDNQ